MGMETVFLGLADILSSFGTASGAFLAVMGHFISTPSEQVVIIMNADFHVAITHAGPIMTGYIHPFLAVHCYCSLIVCQRIFAVRNADE